MVPLHQFADAAPAATQLRGPWNVMWRSTRSTRAIRSAGVFQMPRCPHRPAEDGARLPWMAAFAVLEAGQGLGTSVSKFQSSPWAVVAMQIDRGIWPALRSCISLQGCSCKEPQRQNAHSREGASDLLRPAAGRRSGVLRQMQGGPALQHMGVVCGGGRLWWPLPCESRAPLLSPPKACTYVYKVAAGAVSQEFLG